ncbi:MAG TPA: winged helix-turn-helix domain-containing protein [Verrucomicrobiae bacterium]|nr:winged helix-turn-helix domain-containing protein [Verrucomicrobiae bacterium]
MTYRFAPFELDGDRLELRAEGQVIPIEPQVFALLQMLIEQRARVVTKEELIDQIWNGRAISDSALSSRIKSARRALGDDGAAQRFIRTIHGIGFRFVADIENDHAGPVLSVVSTAPAPPVPAAETSRPSLAVLPFRLVGIAGPYAAVADALPDELIAQLSRLRWLFVISRASSFRFRGEYVDLKDVRAALNVRYCLSGVIELRGDAMNVTVELSDTQDGGVVWGEAFHTKIGGVHDVREEIVRAVVSALELQIPLNEARRARLQAPEQLDAWSAYHLGQQHMFRFTKTDNATATTLFQRAIAQDPNFARAYAGLSFTAFQDAFLSHVPDVDRAIADARRYAEQALERDPLDPFSNLTMGRSHWLLGDLEGSIPWLDRANNLNPNYAQGRYARAFTDPILGEGVSGQEHADAAMALSPLDPLLYAMCASRAFSHIVRGNYEQGALWIDRAIRSPGAHVLIITIGVIAHTLHGDHARAAECAAIARVRDANVSRKDFFRAFPFREPLARARFDEILARYGF